MRTLSIIGIGVGDPDHLTLQAVAALQRVQVVFMIDKGAATSDLVRLRREVCERHLRAGSYRIVEAQDPPRDRDAPAYAPAVAEWHERRAELYERLLADELDEDGRGAILVWGDPSLYDGTLRIVERILARGDLPLDVEVIPGITSVQALAARHRIALNRIGGAVHITTGRRLAQGLPDGADDVVVMLDGEGAFATVPGDDFDIYWGAQLGTEDEILVSGSLRETAGEIARVRAEARAARGWIMDTYLLRRTTG